MGWGLGLTLDEEGLRLALGWPLGFRAWPLKV